MKDCLLISGEGVPMSSNDNTAWLDVFYGLMISGAGCMLGYMGYVFFCSNKPESDLSRVIKLTSRIKECNEMIQHHNGDIVKIRTAISVCHTDEMVHHRELEQQLVSYQFFKPQSVASQSMQQHRFEHRQDMAVILTELLNQYPSLSTHTLEDLNASWHDWEEHHAQVMSLVEVYLPEVHACLNESKAIVRVSTMTI